MMMMMMMIIKVTLRNLLREFSLFCFSYNTRSHSVICQAKIAGKASYANMSGYDEYVPMVDKPVDAEWKRQTSLQRSHTFKGWWLLGIY